MADPTITPKPKQVTLSLTYYVDQWKVTAITNSVWPRPGMMLDETEVSKLCDRPNWEVKIIDNDILATVLGIAKAAIPIPTL